MCLCPCVRARPTPKEPVFPYNMNVALRSGDSDPRSVNVLLLSACLCESGQSVAVEPGGEIKPERRVNVDDPAVPDRLSVIRGG